jgi:hypothetical protein
MTTDEAAQRLVAYIKSRPDFVYHKVDPPYGHIGATIADSVLQANNRYSSVTPRIQRILARWPRENTVTAVLDVLQRVPATQFLNWNGKDRADRFCEVLLLLKREGVETESDFQKWLEKETNLSKLRAIHGIGPKTIDYFRLMVGLQRSCHRPPLAKVLGYRWDSAQPVRLQRRARYRQSRRRFGFGAKGRF